MAGSLSSPGGDLQAWEGTGGFELWHVPPDPGAYQANFPSVHGKLCGLGRASSVFVRLSCFF